MNRQQKTEFINNLKDSLKNAGVVILMHQKGLTVAESSKLRVELREKDAQYKVIKNTLARLAVKDTPYEHLQDKFTGPISLAFSQDPIAAAKVAVKFIGSISDGKLKVVAGGMSEKPLTEKEVSALAVLPSLDELRGKLLGVLVAPATKIARLTKEPGAQIARVIHAYATKNNS